MFTKKQKTLIRLSQKSIYDVYDLQGSKILTKIMLGFSSLCKHKFIYNFEETVNPLCSSALDI